MVLDPETEKVLKVLRDVVDGQVRAALRATDEVNARLVEHETGHQGIALPDIVGWACRQWWAMPSPLRIYVMLYACLGLLALAQWVYRQFRPAPEKPTWGQV